MQIHRPRIGSVGAGSSGLGSGVKHGLCHQGCTGYESAWEILGWRWHRVTDRSRRGERSNSRKDNAEGQEPLWCRGPGTPSGAGTKLGQNAVKEEPFRMCEAADETMLVAGESASDFPPGPRGSYSEGLLKENFWAPPSESGSQE